MIDIDLSGQVAVVTGSSRGIGRAIAELFARAGAKVVVSSRKLEACQPVIEAIKAAGGEAIAIACHVGRRADVEALIAGTHKAYGRVDIMVCNAAINPIYGSMTEVSDEAFDKIMTANVKGVLWACNLVIPQMRDRKKGSIILISSIAGLRGNGVIGTYGMSKAAEAALARNLAVEFGPDNIRINAIAPGLIATDFAKALIDDPERAQIGAQRNPMRRIGQPGEIAGVALFLASDLSSYVNGQTIVVDGGETIS